MFSDSSHVFSQTSLLFYSLIVMLQRSLRLLTSSSRILRWGLSCCAMLCTVALNSCNDFLNENPDSTLNVRIDSEEKIAELLTAAYPQASYFPFLETRTDNVAFRTNGQHTRLNEAMFFWEDDQQDDLDTPLHYWKACYKGIAQANKALELLANYPKTPRVKALYGEAFLLRAYLHFMLVNIWAAPYDKNADSPGIPYVERPEKHAIVDYQRGTVAEVYNKIEKDLQRGISLVDDRYFKQPKFHFNKHAAYAFASRFYLHKGDWTQVVAYADYVLGGDAKPQLRNWRKYDDALEFNHPQLFRHYAAVTEPSNLLITATESRYARQLPTDRYGATIGTMNEVFAQAGIEGGGDYEKLNMVSTYLFSSSPSPIVQGVYQAKFDELSSVESTGSKPRGLYVTNVLLTVDEVLLNRMEALAMLQRYPAAIDDMLDYWQGKFGFMPAVERAVFTNTNRKHYDEIQPSYGLTLKQLAMVRTILGLRRQEFFHEGLRWFDIRRFHLAVKRTDRSSYYHALEKEDPRKLLQIPIQAQERGIAPNPRDRNAVFQ